MNLQEEVARIIQHPQVRSADRANMRRLLEQLNRGRPLSTQERENLWAYVQRYGAQG